MGMQPWQLKQESIKPMILSVLTLAGSAYPLWWRLMVAGVHKPCKSCSHLAIQLSVVVQDPKPPPPPSTKGS